MFSYKDNSLSVSDAEMLWCLTGGWVSTYMLRRAGGPAEGLRQLGKNSF